MRLRLLALVFPLASAAACGGSDGGTQPGTTTKVVSKVTVTAASVSAQPGQNVQLQAVATDASGAAIANAGSIAWTSSSTAIATVDQTGKVSTLSAGLVTITAEVGGVRGTVVITVNAPPAAIKDTIFTLPDRWLPPFVTIKQGESVVFRFGGGIAHNAIFSKFNVPGAPTDIGTFTNQTFSRTFSTKGRFPFECTLHSGMLGEITVE